MQVPAGALDSDTLISISIQNNPPPLPIDLYKASPAISFSPDGTLFDFPVTLIFPYDRTSVVDESRLGVFTYDGRTSSWSPLTVLGYDNGQIYAVTQHFSLFRVAEAIESLPPSDGIDYIVSRDGFSTANDFNPGKCYGMVAFSAWYWEHKRSEGNLNERYTECERMQIITESQNFLQTQTISAWDKYHSQEWIAEQLMISLSKDKKPQILGLYHIDGSSGTGHAVLVYKYERNADSSITFYIYDPNFPGEMGNNVTITYANDKLTPMRPSMVLPWFRRICSSPIPNSRVSAISK